MTTPRKITIRQREPKIFITHDGQTKSIRAWAAQTGLNWHTIMERYRKGWQGEKLFGPVNSPNGGKRHDGAHRKQIKNPKLEAIKVARKQIATDATERASRALTAELSRPLISKSLLTNDERQEIRDRVKYSGQITWRENGPSGVFR